MNRTEEIIVVTAINFLGQQEIHGNMGFKDVSFEEKMNLVGWEKSQAWCAYFAELVWKEAYKRLNEKAIPVLDKLFSALAVATLNNFKRDSRFTCDETPAPGVIIIWQNFNEGKPDWRGHAGIVIAPVPTGFISIEGNTNSAGGREGIEVAWKQRNINLTEKNGLRVMGFIHPADPEIFI